MTNSGGAQNSGSARLQNAYKRSQRIAAAIDLGVDRPTIITSIGRPKSTRQWADGTEEWTYMIDEGVSHDIYFDRDGCIEGHRFSGFNLLEEAIGFNFSGELVQPGDSD